jgi:hypothetical protein
MKKTLLICGALLALTASAAFAAGDINLGQNDCAPIGVVNATLNCAVNTGAPIVLVGSYMPSAILTQFVGLSAVVDLQTNQAVLSPWWSFSAGGCRNTVGPPAVHGLSTSFDFTSGPFTCTDFFAGQALGASQYDTPSPGIGTPNSARLRIAGAQAVGGEVDPGTEYYGFKVTINKTATVGTPVCPGCTDAVCIVFNQITLGSTAVSGVKDQVITSGPQQYCTVNGGVAGAQLCPSSTPTKNGTWGQIKALYR